MILVRPCHLPWRFLPEEEHAAFAAGRDDLVGAIGECRRVAEGTHRPAAKRRAMRLRALLYPLQVMPPRQSQGSIHFAGPASPMNGAGGTGTRRQDEPSRGARAV